MPLTTRDLTLLDNALASNDFFSTVQRLSSSLPHIAHHFVSDVRINSPVVIEGLRQHPIIAEEFTHCGLCNRYHFMSRGREVLIGHDCDSVQRWCVNCVNISSHQWGDGSFHNVRPPSLSNYGVCDYHRSDRDSIFGRIDYTDRSLLGIEIETSMTNFQAIREALDVGKVVAERDGSLDSQTGVEYVFAPCSLDQVVPGEYVHKIATILHNAKTKAWSDDRCGMHVSMNSSRMTHLHAGKVCKFVNSHKSLFNLLSGRTNNQYANYDSRTLTWESNNSHQDKYRAASRRGPERLEIRIFRSSVNFKRIRQNCEVVDSVREFTRMASVRELTQYHYFDFLNQSENRNKYRVLRQFLGLLPKKKNPPKSGKIDDECLVDEANNQLVTA